MTESGESLDVGRIRGRAARRLRVRGRLRRIVPGVVVSSGALVGTGGFVAWVSAQPGLQATSPPPAAAASAAARTALSPTGPDTQTAKLLNDLTAGLQLDNAQLAQVERDLGALARRRAAETARVPQSPYTGAPSAPAGTPALPAAAGASYPSGADQSVPTLPPLAPIAPVGPVNVPTVAPVSAAPAPAPATNGTTGASHAAP